MNKAMRDLRALCEREGFVILSVEQRRHYKLRLQKDDVEFTVTASVSASDNIRTLHNLRSDIRRAFRTATQREVSA